MTHGRGGTIIRSIWPLGSDTRPVPLAPTGSRVPEEPVMLFRILADGRVLVGDDRSRSRPAVEVVLACGTCWLVTPERGGRSSGVPICLNGRGVPGALGGLNHGDVISVGIAAGRTQFWLSREGPALRMRLPTASEDALSLEPLNPGTVVVPCGCGAVFSETSWSEVRRCPVCDFREDGVYREVPSACETPPHAGEALA